MLKMYLNMVIFQRHVVLEIKIPPIFTQEWKKKWDDKLQEKDFIKVDNKDRKPKCDSYDSKRTYVNSGTNTSGRVNFFTGKGKRKKYLGVVVKWDQKILVLL